MALLNSYKLTLYKRTNRNNSFLKCRRKLIAKIDEQILLATVSNYKPTKIKWVRNEDGSERKLEIPKRARRWWTEQLGGTILLTIRYESKALDVQESMVRRNKRFSRIDANNDGKITRTKIDAAKKKHHRVRFQKPATTPVQPSK